MKFTIKEELRSSFISMTNLIYLDEASTISISLDEKEIEVGNLMNRTRSFGSSETVLKDCNDHYSFKLIVLSMWRKEEDIADGRR